MRGHAAPSAPRRTDRQGTRGRDSLSPVEREVAAISDLRQEVNSGGFDGYFRYWGDDSAIVARAALPSVLRRDWAEVSS